MNVYEDKYLREKVNGIFARQKEGNIVIRPYLHFLLLPSVQFVNNSGAISIAHLSECGVSRFGK